MLPGSTLETLPVLIFQFSAHRLEFLNREIPLFPGLTSPKLSKILRGDWRKLVPEEFHPVVLKLGSLLKSQGHTTVEFPIYWMGNTIRPRIFTAAVSERKGANKIIGLAQDVTVQRQSSLETDSLHEHLPEEEDDHWRKLRHDISSSLTSIFMNCEILLDGNCAPEPRRRIAAVLAEALRINEFLQQYRG